MQLRMFQQQNRLSGNKLSVISLKLAQHSPFPSSA
jgi:hypothetical protein